MKDRPPILVAAAVSRELTAFRPNRKDLVCVAAGMGPRAGRSVRAFLSRQAVSWVVSVGFAGAASSDLRVGDLVLASEVVDASSGCRLRPSIPPEGMVEGARVGPFVTVPQPLVRPADKGRHGERFGAIAVEMETSAVAAAAVEAGTRWLSLRAILDPMEIPLVVASVPQAIFLMAQPWQWPRLTGFMGSVRVAGESLARGLGLLLERLNSHR